MSRIRQRSLAYRSARLATLWLAAASVALAAVAAALASDRARPPDVDALSVPANNATRLGLYVSAASLPWFLAQSPPIPIIDVRDREQARIDGPSPFKVAAVPFFVSAGAAQTPLEPSDAAGAPLTVNPRFVRGVLGAIARAGRRQDVTIVLICSGGVHSARAADHLADHGFTRVYSLVGGVWALSRTP